LTDDSQIQELNAQYRQQNKPTDVLAFAALEVDFPQSKEMLASVPLYLGDIIVSVDTAQRQAQQQEHSLLTELVWLVAHGLLHLLGWDHPDEKSLERMLKQQVILLNTIGIAIDME
jgi:probable rRNA maturation factor